jgi:hypothetical protein
MRCEHRKEITMSADRSFGGFGKTPEGRRLVGDEFIKRLEQYGKPITLLPQLRTFVRDRWPNDFPPNWRLPSPPGARYSRENVTAWWSAYLAWCESGEEAA